ncbi:MAG: HDOD domain-containing protein [Paludisphaera borealis]|uniref:HDOD domain-containing protein n=1 Tax=Paludisphaera borealis TaxID=1387353 RepID=UPI002849B298|nr:HDOD domain-containing protein [Paludisphaera borealis]MDR3622944.1 HDOD domain-containing protein [Paludisphaera borealis]
MRVHAGRKSPGGKPHSRLQGLSHLPVRPHSARAVMAAVASASSGEPSDAPAPGVGVGAARGGLDLDPGWVLAERTRPGRADPLEIVAETAWWPSTLATGPCTEAIQRLWRHSVAVALACRSLAREKGDRDPDQLVRAGLLHGIGRWAVAAVDPDWFARWLNENDRTVRRRLELADLGTDMADLGRRLAERWGCEPLIVDAAWLHDDSAGALASAAREPERLAMIQEAVRWAESTPWSLNAPGRESLPTEPRLRILVAEVQSKCASMFATADASPHEERMTRENARLHLRLAALSRTNATQQRIIHALADDLPHESTESWTARAGMIWCEEPEVNAARVVWRDPEWPEAEPATAEGDGLDVPSRPASWTIPLESRTGVVAEIQLWLDPDQTELRGRLERTRVIEAWRSWAARIADRDVLERRLQAVVRGSRQSAEDEEERTRSAKLDALAEFAAGAGHELNNPLAVIVGRAQLLLAKAADPATARSLRIILSQAQRTHRILRDLMFVARPPEPRPRACRPADVLRACLAEFEAEAESRGIRLTSEVEASDQPTWMDPDAFRHLADILIRNALQASVVGGKIQVRSSRQGQELRLSVADGGKGVSSSEGAHLFDPFFCGRQAGRGLGLGLPRAARMVALAGGSLTWSSAVGQGSAFNVQLPLQRPPDEPTSASI